MVKHCRKKKGNSAAHMAWVRSHIKKRGGKRKRKCGKRRRKSGKMAKIKR